MSYAARSTRRLVDIRWPVSVAFVLALLVVWEAIVAWAALPSFVLSPTQIVSAFVGQLTSHDLLGATGHTLTILVPGFVVGTGLGVLVGWLAGVWRAAEDVVDSFVSVTYPLPKITLFPLFVVWLGFSDSARILVICLSLFYPAFVNALAGTRAVEARFVWVARNLAVGRARTFVNVVIPGALPATLAGIRISLALGFVLAYAAEAIGAGQTGLGVLVNNSYLNLQYAPMYAGILMFAILGFGADRLLKLVSDRLLRGQRLEADRG